MVSERGDARLNVAGRSSPRISSRVGASCVRPVLLPPSLPSFLPSIFRTSFLIEVFFRRSKHPSFLPISQSRPSFFSVVPLLPSILPFPSSLLSPSSVWIRVSAFGFLSCHPFCVSLVCLTSVVCLCDCFFRSFPPASSVFRFAFLRCQMSLTFPF